MTDHEADRYSHDYQAGYMQRMLEACFALSAQIPCQDVSMAGTRRAVAHPFVPNPQADSTPCAYCHQHPDHENHGRTYP